VCAIPGHSEPAFPDSEGYADIEVHDLAVSRRAAHRYRGLPAHTERRGNYSLSMPHRRVRPTGWSCVCELDTVMRDWAGELNQQRGWTVTLILAVVAKPDGGDHGDEGVGPEDPGGRTGGGQGPVFVAGFPKNSLDTQTSLTAGHSLPGLPI